jgi:predicted DNA-binding ribbon-helix-helix protein
MCVKRSVVLAGHKTSISVEDEFWVSLKAIAASQQTTLSALLNAIDCERDYNNLSSNIRRFVLNFYREHFEKHQTATITTHDSPLSPLR